MKLNQLTFLLLIISFFSYSQTSETVYYDDDKNVVDSINATTYLVKTIKDIEKVYQVIKHYTIDGRLIEVKNYINWEIEYYDTQIYVLNGISKKYHKNGVLKEFRLYKADRLDGKLLTYYENGQLKREDLYIKGEFISGKCYDKEGNEIKHFDYKIAPIYKGGQQAIQEFFRKNAKILPRHFRLGIRNNVIVEFTVLKNGSISDINIVASTNDYYSKEAKRLILLMKDWIPTIIDGEYVDYTYQLPMNFN